MLGLAFPLAFVTNTYALVLVMIGVGLLGRPEMASDLAVVHAATAATLYALSGNARSLVLSSDQGVSVSDLLRLRLLLILPLLLVAFVISNVLITSGVLFTVLLILRRGCEWLAEILLSGLESDQRTDFALKYGGLQFALVPLIVGGLILFPEMFWVYLLPWAFSPLLFSGVKGALSSGGFERQSLWSLGVRILPHLGSSAIIGVSVYLFRAFIIVIVGSSVSGVLFTAFAIGGIVGGVLPQAFGPALVHASGGRPIYTMRLGQLYHLLNFTACLAGIALVVLQWAGSGWLGVLNQPPIFWYAAGFSLIGGAVMSYALLIRFRILQGKGGRDVFSADLLANVALILSVPFLYAIAAEQALVCLILFSAILSLVFYLTQDRTPVDRLPSWLKPYLRRIATFVLLSPVFFLVDGSLFYSASPYYVSSGKLSELPFPISILAIGALIVLFAKYQSAKLALNFMFLSFIALFLSILVRSTGESGIQQSEMLSMVQYLSPILGLCLGMQVCNGTEVIKDVAKGAGILLAILIPCQVIITWQNHGGIIINNIGRMTIYQGYQYVPLMMVSFYLIGLYSLWASRFWRYLFITLSPFVLLYVVMSLSTAALFTFVTASLVFVFLRLFRAPGDWRAIALFCAVTPLLLAAWSTGFLSYVALILPTATESGEMLSFWDRVSLAGLQRHEAWSGVVSEKAEFSNLASRVEMWGYYLDEVTATWKTVLFGVMEDSPYPSAHNYFLDYSYAFGLVGLLPVLCLIFLTAYWVLGRWRQVWASQELLALVGVLACLVLVDNMLKVGLRQPYSGILTFYLWGLLIVKMLPEKEDGGGISAKIDSARGQ
ncbi:MAG: hypothetical protein CL537_00060 [Alcanivoracaceae bacterium]|nr:hypothetical protein [Alcanivoracaceae bacterium]